MERLLLFAEELFEKKVSLDYFSLYMLALIVCAFAFLAVFAGIQNRKKRKKLRTSKLRREQ